MLTIDQVTRIAVEAHEGQVDKTDLPYILHPVWVASTLHGYGMPMHLVHAGLLHDVIEDTEFDEHVLADRGVADEVIDIVWSVSKNKTKEDGQTYHDWIRGMVRDPLAATVKYVDSMHNLLRNDSLILQDAKRGLSMRGRYERNLEILRDSVLFLR